MMNQGNDGSDAELAASLKELADQNQLIDYLADLLAAADRPTFTVGGVAVSLMAADDPPINDKECYKACLREDMRHPGTYAKCIEGCRPKASLTFEVMAQVR